MTNEERVNKFKNEKIAINCETEDEAKEFIKWCYLNEITWTNKKLGMNKTYYKEYKKTTCYIYHNKYQCLQYCSDNYYIIEGWKVVKYKDFMKEKSVSKMTNLEYLITLGTIDNTTTLCSLAYKCKHKRTCRGVTCSECEFYKDSTLSARTLLEEHIDIIELKKWEFDLITTNNVSNKRTFESVDIYKNMKNIGYFEGVEDTSMTIQEILENCKIVE